MALDREVEEKKKRDELQRGYEKSGFEQEGCTGQSSLEELHIWKPSDPCSHRKTDVKPIMMMMM